MTILVLYIIILVIIILIYFYFSGVKEGILGFLMILTIAFSWLAIERLLEKKYDVITIIIFILAIIFLLLNVLFEKKYFIK